MFKKPQARVCKKSHTYVEHTEHQHPYDVHSCDWWYENMKKG